MKYLKKYESYNSLELEINDILLDIKDDDNLSVNIWEENHSFFAYITPSDQFGKNNQDGDGLSLSKDHKESIKRLLSYLESEGYVYRMVMGTDNIPPVHNVDLNDYVGPLTIDELDGVVELYFEDYIGIIDIRK